MCELTSFCDDFYICDTLENTVSLLFKVISQYLKRPPVLISKETDPALAHLPSVEHSPELSHRKAIYLQGE